LPLSGSKDVEFGYDANFGGRPNGATTRAALEALTKEADGAAGVPSRLRACHAIPAALDDPVRRAVSSTS
jgi:hypothetical protein